LGGGGGAPHQTPPVQKMGLKKKTQGGVGKDVAKRKEPARVVRKPNRAGVTTNSPPTEVRMYPPVPPQPMSGGRFGRTKKGKVVGEGGKKNLCFVPGEFGGRALVKKKN